MQVKAHTVYWFCFNTLDRETVVDVMRRSRSSRRCKTLEEMFITLQKPKTVLQKQSPSTHHQIINEVSIQIQYRGSRIHGRGWECVWDTCLHYVGCSSCNVNCFLKSTPVCTALRLRRRRKRRWRKRMATTDWWIWGRSVWLYKKKKSRKNMVI